MLGKPRQPLLPASPLMRRPCAGLFWCGVSGSGGLHLDKQQLHQQQQEEKQQEEEKLPEQWSVCCKKTETETETLRTVERRALFD